MKRKTKTKKRPVRRSRPKDRPLPESSVFPYVVSTLTALEQRVYSLEKLAIAERQNLRTLAAAAGFRVTEVQP